MSWHEEAKKVAIRDFLGAMPALEPTDIPPGGAIASYNMLHRPGQVRTRPGFGAALAADGEQRELFSWSQGAWTGQKNWLAYLKDNTSVRVIDLGDPTMTPYTIASSFSASRVSFAPWGQRLYFALLANDMRGSNHGKVWGGDTSVAASNCFQRPLLAVTEVTMSFSEPSYGVVTAGLHAFYYLFRTREGFWTRPSPANGNMDPLPYYYIASGGKNITATITPVSAWPDWITEAQLCMSAAVTSLPIAPRLYLVPGTLQNVSSYRGTSSSISTTVSIDDATLVSSADPADEFERLIVQTSAASNPPFLPFGVCTWGKRMVWFASYGGVDSILISDENDPQHLTADQHVLQLPGGVAITGWFVLRNVLYVLSSGATYAFSDNGDKPVNFSPPVEIDSTIGVPSSGAVTVTGGTSGYAIVASPQGLYLFNGANYPQAPLSLHQSSVWSRIDWSAVNEMKLLDYTREKLIIFRCKMRDSTYRMLTWSYLEGMSPDRVKFSEWFFWTVRGMPAIVPVGVSSKGQELWVGAGAVGPYDVAVRMKIPDFDEESTLYLDYDATTGGLVQTPWSYQIGPLPPRASGEILRHLGCELRASGSGRFYIRAVKLSEGIFGSPPNSLNGIEVAFAAGQTFYQVLLPDPNNTSSPELISEALFWLIGNGELDFEKRGWASISTLIHYFNLARFIE